MTLHIINENLFTINLFNYSQIKQEQLNLP